MGVAITDDGRFVGEWVNVRSRLGRADVEVPIALGNDAGEWTRGVVRNASIGGMFVATRRSLPVGARVVARLSSADEKERDEIEARVCWSRRSGAGDASPPGVGLEFAGSKVRAAIFVRVLLRSGRRSWG